MKSAVRRSSLGNRWTAVFNAAVACAALVALAPTVVLAQSDAAEEDPFADELNPFGGQPKPQESDIPATPPAPQLTPPPLPTPQRMPSKPPIQLPVPFPESDDFDEPAPRRGRPTTQAPPRRDFRLPRGEDDIETWEPSPAEKLVVEAEKLDKSGDLAGAKAKLLEALRLDPKLTIGWLALGVVSRRLGDLEGAVDACSKGIAIDPNVAELYLRRGIAWYHLGHYGIAMEDFEEAAGMAYDDPRPELWRGLTLVALDRPLEAINAYAASIRRDREFVLGYINRGLAYLSIDEPRKAEFDFDMAIRRNPRDARAWFNRGVAQARQRRYAEAINSYGEALKHDPGLEAARRNKAAVEAVAGRR